MTQLARTGRRTPEVGRGRTAVVIGSGPNGLVAANVLADHGWSVLVCEAQPTLGGAVRSDQGVADGFTHDTFSSFYPLGVASPVIRALHLEDHGLVWKHAPAVVGHPMPGGRWALLHREVTDTAAGLELDHPGDGEAWIRLVEAWQATEAGLLEALLSPFPPVRGALRTLRGLPAAGGPAWVATLLSPVNRLTGRRFRGLAARLLITGNAMHADIDLDAPGSGLLGMLLALIGQTHGFPVPEGGASRLSGAMVERLRSLGGATRTDTRIDRVLIRDRQAYGVVTDSGEQIEADAVLADVSAPALYHALIDSADLPFSAAVRMHWFSLDPGTLKVDWALSGPVPWSPAPGSAPGTVHIGDSVEELTTAQRALNHGVIPAKPFLLTGQTTTADPTRSPAGTESLWAYTHIPQHVRGDLGEDRLTGRWDHTEIERLADRMQARIEAYAPGFADRIAARRVLGPRDLEERDENLVQGALGGGTNSLRQQLFLRPFPGLGRAETPIRGLFLASSSAHPGGGVHGACGANAARAALFAARTGRLA